MARYESRTQIVDAVLWDGSKEAGEKLKALIDPAVELPETLPAFAFTFATKHGDLTMGLDSYLVKFEDGRLLRYPSAFFEIAFKAAPVGITGEEGPPPTVQKLVEILSKQDEALVEKGDWDPTGITVEHAPADDTWLVSLKNTKVGFVFNKDGVLEGVFNWKE